MSSSLSTTQPRWPRTRPPRTWNTCTAASSSSSAKATTSASVPSPNTTACFSIARRSASRSSRSAGGELELEVVTRLGHPPLEAPDHRVGLAGHEVAEVVDDLAVLVGADPADARGAALADVAEQAGPPDLPGALEHAGAAGTRREHPQQQVEGLADGPGVAVRAEVAHALALRAAHHLQPRVLLVQVTASDG